MLVLFTNATTSWRTRATSWFEEEGGYLSDALAVAPHLSKHAAVLSGDHRKFAARFAMLAALARDPKKTIASWELIVNAIREFTEELRQQGEQEEGD